jgi:cytochrome c2
VSRSSWFFVGLCAVGGLILGGSTLGLQNAKAQGQLDRPSVPAITSRTTPPLPSGERLFARKCSGCHELDEHDRGPAIRTVAGRIAGHEAGFSYSPALRTSWFRWDDASLNTWLQGPANMIPGTRMRTTIRSPQERAAIIAYLNHVKSQPAK